MVTPKWDAFEIAEFFDLECTPFEFEDEDAGVCSLQDSFLCCELITLPQRSIICITLRDRDSGTIVLDLSVLIMTRLERRVAEGNETLYCHECVVLPGIHAYRSNSWYAFYGQGDGENPRVSLSISRDPRLSVRFYDPSPDDRPDIPGIY